MSRVVCLHLNVIAANYSKEGKKKEESSEGGRPPRTLASGERASEQWIVKISTLERRRRTSPPHELMIGRFP